MKNFGGRLFQRVRHLLKELHTRVHFRFPNLVPDVPENKIFHKEKDAEENQESKVPLEEDLRQAAVWGVELYGPKEIATLYEGIERLGWAGGRFGIPDSDVLEWVRRVRRYGHGGSRDLGVVCRPKEKGAGREYFSPMPDTCKYLLISINQITPSLTAVLVYFVLNKETAKIYETILNTDRKTFYKRLKGRSGYSIPGVLNQKGDMIEKARLQRADIASSWFAQHLPGMFSGGALINELPTGELIAMNSHVSFKNTEDDHDRGKGKTWAHLLGVNRRFDGWLHPEHAGFGLILDERRENKKYHSIVTLTTSALPDDLYLFSNGRSWGAYHAFVYGQIKGVAIRLAASNYLSEIGRRIRDARECVGQASRSRVAISQTLNQIEGFYRSAIGDPAIAEEMSGLDESEFDWDCTKFVSADRDFKDTLELPSALHKMTKRIADGVHAEGRSARQLFQEVATTLSTRESIRAQRRMETLTILAIVVAGIGVYFGVTGE